MSRLRIIPLDDEVVFPGMPVTLSVDVGSDTRVLLVPRRQNIYAGVAAHVRRQGDRHTREHHFFIQGNDS